MTRLLLPSALHSFLSCFTFALWLCLAPQAFAAEWETQNFLRQMSSALANTPSPTMAELVPGYTRPRITAPGIAVADLDTATGTEGNWGKAIGQILRWDLAYSYQPALPTSDFYNYYPDAFSPDASNASTGRSAQSATLVATRLGLEHALSGRIGVKGSGYELELNLQRLSGQQPPVTFKLSGTLDDLPATLDSVALRIYTALGQQAPKPRPNRATRLDARQLQQLVTTLTPATEMPASERAARARKIWHDGIKTPLTAAHVLQHITVESPQAYLEQLDAIRAQFPDDDGVDLIVARLAPFRDGLLQIKHDRLARLMLERTADPMPLLILADALADSGNSLGGVALAREAVQRWPDNYRSWWTLGYSLMQYAWELRGTGFWKDVPKAAQDQFPVLRELSGRIADKALALNRDNSGLWVLKMYTIGHYSDDYMRAYTTAIRLDPKNKRAYESALNYTLPQWGGSHEAQRAVLDTARENINDPAWLEKVRTTYVSDQATGQTYQRISSWLSNHPLLWALIVIIVLASGFLLWRRR